MSQQREQQVRTAIEQLLVAAVEGRDDPHDLEIAKQQARTLHSLARSLLAVMKRNAKPGDAARDYVFQAFMQGRRTERLAVRLPRAFLLLINRGQRDAMPARLAADARRLQIAGLAGVPILALLVFGGTTAWKNVPEAMVRLGTPQRFENGRVINVDSILAAQQGPIQQAIETPDEAGPEEGGEPVPDADTGPGSGLIDRASFYNAYRTAFGDLDYQASAGLDQLLGFLENDPDMRDIRLRAYVLATVKYETSDRFVPTTKDDPQGYQRFEPGTPLGNQVGNKVPGDGELFRARGYNGLTGRDNYYRMSQVLGFEPKMSTLIDDPDKANEPRLAYRIMSLGMRGGLFTGRKLSDFINETQTDYFNASAVNGNDVASRQLESSARLFEDILRRSADRTPVAATSS
jgi:hypothetical protein